jgi:hypothetical protein
VVNAGPFLVKRRSRKGIALSDSIPAVNSGSSYVTEVVKEIL